MAWIFFIMKLTYSDIKDQYLRNIGLASSSDATILANFQVALSHRYQLVLSHLKDYQTQDQKTASTVASQQYYSYPVGVTRVTTASITIGSVTYPLQIINSQYSWNVLNAIQIQPSAIPQFIFPRRSDFGIWPIPQAVYTINFYHFIRDRNLAVDDYTGGTISLTAGDTTVTGTSTAFTAGMVGRWLTVTDTSNPDYGYWYRITDYSSATSIEIENSWQGTTTASAVTYKIGQCPEIPDEGHIILVDGATADYYSGSRANKEDATWWNNKFWTGDGNNNDRRIGDDNIKGGLIGLINSYADRDNSALVRRQPKVFPPQFKVFAQTIT